MKKPNLTNIERGKIMQELLMNLKNDKPRKGVMQQIANKYEVCPKTITNIWNDTKKQKEAGLLINVNSKMKGKKGKAKIQFDAEAFKAIPYTQRTTIKRIAKALNVSQSTVQRWRVAKLIRKHTNVIKPLLSEENKLKRLMFSLMKLYLDHDTANIKFASMDNVVHIDEKWFYLTRATQNYYIVEGEEVPHRTIQSKKFIPKIMFMCAVARPLYGPNGEVIFDGKLGIWPFISQEPAKNNSKNRRAGTLETKPIQSVTREIVRECLIEKVMPAIRAKWPEGATKDIIIQQDNAKPHIDNADPIFREAASSGGFNIVLKNQPPNSPDMNVLDLGFFRAIQSLQYDTAAYRMEELVNAVEVAYVRLDAKTLNYVWISWQACMLALLGRKGGIDYDIPHMGKSKLAREGRLPQYLDADREVVKSCIAHMKSQNPQADLENLMDRLGIHAREISP